MDQNLLEVFFNQIKLILDNTPPPHTNPRRFHSSIQSMLRIIAIIVQRSRMVLTQQLLPDLQFVRLVIRLWDTCMIGPSNRTNNPPNRSSNRFSSAGSPSVPILRLPFYRHRFRLGTGCRLGLMISVTQPNLDVAVHDDLQYCI